MSSDVKVLLRRARSLLEEVAARPAVRGAWWDQSLEGFPREQSPYVETARSVSPAGLAHIKDSEKLRLEAYLDARGRPTIGWGHTGPEVKLGQVITKEQADVLFARDVQRVLDRIRPVILVPTTQEQFDALVSLAYNIGVNAFRTSTLLRRLNAGDAPAAAREFLRWSKLGHEENQGLKRRRQAESTSFQEADEG